MTEKRKLHILKNHAHKVFDKLWKSNIMTRDECYNWLSIKLNIPKELTHIKYFKIEQCKDVIYFSNQLLEDMRLLDKDFGIYN